MKLTMGINDATADSPVIPSGQWNSIYLAYALTAGGAGYMRIYINGNTGPIINIQNAPTPSAFQNTDSIKVGGAFSGELRRMQIYSPGTIGTFTGPSITSFLLLVYNK